MSGVDIGMEVREGVPVVFKYPTDVVMVDSKLLRSVCSTNEREDTAVDERLNMQSMASQRPASNFQRFFCFLVVAGWLESLPRANRKLTY